MRVTSLVTSGELKEGESYPLVGTRNGRYLIVIKGWKVSYLASDFKPLERKDYATRTRSTN